MAFRLTSLLITVGLASCSVGQDGTPASIVYANGRLLCRLDNRRVNESSGLAVGRANPGVFWTHNDSGERRAALYAFDAKGGDRGEVRIAGVLPSDCEAMESYTLGGKHYLLLADTGDNSRRRSRYYLYIVEEPELPAERAALKVPVAHAVRFAFKGGPQDGEGVAVDTESRKILLATRDTARPRCLIFQLDLPTEKAVRNAVAEPVAMLKIRNGNALTVSPDGRRLVVGTYWDAYEFTRGKDETWRDALTRPGRKIAMPKRRKGEGIAYGTDGRTLYLTSEGAPCPLYEVAPR
jgi:hypothetical protein